MIILIRRNYHFFPEKRSCFLKCAFIGMKHLPEKSLSPAGKTLCSFDEAHIQTTKHDCFKGFLKNMWFCMMTAGRLRAPRLISPFHSQTPTKITAIEFYPKGNPTVPGFWNNADEPGQDGWVKKILDMPVAVFITQENLWH